LTRFIVTNLDTVTEAPAEPEIPGHTYADMWILTKTAEVVATTNRLMDAYQFGEAGRQIYDFLWGDFADWYVEVAKVQLEQGASRAWLTLSVLYEVLDTSLRLLHPYIPFVTEATWQQLREAFSEAAAGIGGGEQSPALMLAEWPSAGEMYPEQADAFERLRELVRNIRAVRAEYNVPAARFVTATISGGELAGFLGEQRDVLQFLARLDGKTLTIARDVDAPENAVTIPLGDLTCYLPLSGLVDVEQERHRLEAELVEVQSQIKRLTDLLASPFAERAPEAVVAKERDKLSRFEGQAEELQLRIRSLI
jgi:valyl-tRNA synthetase